MGLKPYDDPAWRGSIRNKPQLIDAIQKKLDAFPGIIFNYTSQPKTPSRGRDRSEELAGREDFGADLGTLESRAEAAQRVLAKVPGISNITLVRELGQPSLTIEPDRAKIARYGLNVSDINALIETAVGGAPATQVIQGSDRSTSWCGSRSRTARAWRPSRTS